MRDSEILNCSSAGSIRTMRWPRVTVRCKRRSTFTGDPLLWRPAFQAHGREHPLWRRECDGGGLQPVRAGLRGARAALDRGQESRRAAVQVTAWSCGGTSWPSAATSALTATPIQVATLAARTRKESTPGVGRIGSEIRILYGDGGKLYCVQVDERRHELGGADGGL